MLNPTQTAATISNLKSQLRNLGIDMPAAVVTAIKDADERAASITAPTDNDIADAIGKALDAGKDPATDKAVLTLLARRDIAQPRYVARLHDAAVDAHRTAVVAHAHTIVAELSDVVEAADDVIQEAARRNGTDHDARNAEPLVKLAMERLDLAVKAWKGVAMLAGVRGLNTDTQPMIIAPAQDDEIRPGTYDALAPARRAVPLTLCALDDFAERIEDRKALREQAEREAERVQRAAIHAAFGFGRI